jgi:peroxiredoxin Q/BCP
MKQWHICFLAGAVMVTTMAGQVTAAELKSGDVAPNFELPGSDGKTHKLADFKGKKAVVIAWYPKAFTGG